MKKILALILALAMIFALAACGQAAAPAANEAPAAEEAAPAAEEAAPAAEPAAEAKTVKVGFMFLHDEQSTYDKNFMDAAKEACEKLGVEYVLKTGVPEGQECYETALDLVDEGCNIVFADSFGHEDYMIQAAKECPDVEFCHATGTKAHTEGLANFHNAFASIYEGRFLAGVAAGLKLNEMIESGKITAEKAIMGYVGAYTYAEVISGYTSFFLGAKSVCPSVTMKVTFTGSWYDMPLEQEGAQKLIDSGCVLISQHADSMGAPNVCQANGVPNVSYNGSTKEAGPDTYIVSSTGSVELLELNEAVAAEGTAAKLEEVKAGLADGSIHVFATDAYTVGGANETSHLADVDTDPAYTPDTEVIADGYFHESEFRSAPYFDIQIDGIELLDTAF